MALPRRILETGVMMAPTETKPTSKIGYVSAGSFDSNMLVILAALLCALIGALGVNSIVRCFLRCRYRLNMESPEEARERLAATGLKKRDLGQIPVVVYGGDVNMKGTECPICLGEFRDGVKVRVLPICNHGFHVVCIDKWLLSHSSCPNCRHSLLPRPPLFKGAALVPPPPLPLPPEPLIR